LEIKNKNLSKSQLLLKMTDKVAPSKHIGIPFNKYAYSKINYPKTMVYRE